MMIEDMMAGNIRVMMSRSADGQVCSVIIWVAHLRPY